MLERTVFLTFGNKHDSEGRGQNIAYQSFFWLKKRSNLLGTVVETLGHRVPDVFPDTLPLGTRITFGLSDIALSLF